MFLFFFSAIAMLEFQRFHLFFSMFYVRILCFFFSISHFIFHFDCVHPMKILIGAAQSLTLVFFSLFDVRYRRICHHAHSLSSRFWWCLFLWFHFNSIANIQTHYTCICGSFDYNFLHFSLTIIFIHPHKLVCICARLLDFILMDGTWYLFFPFEYHKMHWKQEKNGN